MDKKVGGRLVILSGPKGTDSDMKSSWLSVLSDISQPSMLARLLFHVFISDLHDLNWFADDSQLGRACGALKGGGCHSERPWQAGEVV